MSQDFFRSTLDKLTQLNESAQIGMYETRGAQGIVDTEHYSWGDLKIIRVGHDFSIPLHPEHIEQLCELPNHKSTTITDETNSSWLVTKENDEMTFEDRRGNSVVVPTVEICGEELDEGTWSTPDTPEKQQRLAKILSRPLSAEAATHALYNYVGDDELFDKIDAENEFYGREDIPAERQDVRDLVIGWMSRNADRFPEFGPVLDQVGQLNELSQNKMKRYRDRAEQDFSKMSRDARNGKDIDDDRMARRERGLGMAGQKIDELSPDTLKNYRGKAERKISDISNRSYRGEPINIRDKMATMKGLDRAARKINELSPDTLKKYTKAAKNDLRNAERIHGSVKTKPQGWGTFGDEPAGEYFAKLADKRSRGIDRALDRLEESYRTVPEYQLMEAPLPLDQEVVEPSVNQEPAPAAAPAAKPVMTAQQQQQMTKAAPGVQQAQTNANQAAGEFKQTAAAAKSATANANDATANLQAASQKLSQAPQQKAPAKPAAPMAQNKPTDGQYVIKRGDTLSAIAKANGTTVQAIMQANPQIKDANRIAAGAGLNLPQQTPAAQPAQQTPAAQPNGQQGDDDAGIAQMSQQQYTRWAQGNPQEAAQFVSKLSSDPNLLKTASPFFQQQVAAMTPQQKQQVAQLAKGGAPAPAANAKTTTPNTTTSGGAQAVAESIKLGDIVRFETAPELMTRARVVAINEGQLTVKTRSGTEYLISESEVKEAMSDLQRKLAQARADSVQSNRRKRVNASGSHNERLDQKRDDQDRKKRDEKKCVNESGEEVWTVTYHNKQGKAESERDFHDKAAADAHAKKGNAKETGGGKYKVTKTRGVNEADCMGLGEKKGRRLKGPVVEAKPDFLDKDKDGNKKEPMKKAIKDKEKCDESKMPDDYQSYQGKGNHRPGWMLKADPALGKKVRDAKRAARPPLSKPSDKIDEISDAMVNRTADARLDAVKSADRSNRDETMASYDKFSKNQRLGAKRDVRQQKAGKKPDPRSAEYQNAEPGRRNFGDSVEPCGQKLNELSKDTMTSYIKKASAGAQDFSDVPDERKAGVHMAMKKKHNMGAKVPATDELNELSKDTMKSYLKKANVSRGNLKYAAGAAAEKGDWDTEYEKNRKAGQRKDSMNQALDKLEEKVDLSEKAVSKKQQKFMGMVHAAQKGEKPASKKVADVAKTMKKSDAKDFAKTKHKGLPNKKKTDECTTSGGVAVAASPFKYQNEATMKPVKTDKNGVYENQNKKLERMISESMNVSVSMNKNSEYGGPTKTLNINATDEDAEQLARLLNLAGLGNLLGGEGGEQQAQMAMPMQMPQQQVPAAGMVVMGPEEEGEEEIEALEENMPDWPTNPETSNDPFQYSGGLNRPKSTGQTTVPVTPVAQMNHRGGMFESSELERTLFKAYQAYKGE